MIHQHRLALHHRAPFLFCVISILAFTSGCALQQAPGGKPAASHSQKPASHIAMATMEPGFLYLAAQNAIKEGQLPLASKLLEALVKKDPSATQPHLQLVQLLLQQRQFEKAATHISQLETSDALDLPQQRELDFMRVRLNLGRGKLNAALKQLDSVLANHPNNMQALELKIEILSRQKKPDAAVRMIKHALRLQDTPGLRLLQAQLLLQQKQPKAAKLALLRMKELAPDDDVPILMLNKLAQQQKQLDEAETYLRDFLQNHPDALRVSNALGRMLVKENRLVEAILVYRDIDARTGGEPTVLQALGLLYYQHKDYDQAAATFRKLLTIQHSDEASFYLANSLEATGHHQQARKIYAAIASDSSLYDDAQLRLAGLDAMENMPEKAARRLQQIIHKHPEHLMAYAMLSSIRIAQKDYRKALKETDNTLAIQKLPPRLLFNRAIAFDHFKDYEQVESMLKRILAQDSRHSEALNFLAYTYAVQGTHLDEAESLIRRALDQKPDDGYYLDSLAWIQYKRGNIKQALHTQKSALKKITDDAVMREHLGDILWANQQHDAARQAWRQAIKLHHDDPKALRKKIADGLPSQ